MSRIAGMHDGLTPVSITSTVLVIPSMKSGGGAAITIIFDDVHFHTKWARVIVACLDITVIWKASAIWADGVKVRIN